jgi:hypothetical protein
VAVYLQTGCDENRARVRIFRKQAELNWAYRFGVVGDGSGTGQR